MPDRSRRRAGKHRVAGRRRADELGQRLGRGIRQSRTAAGSKQSELGPSSGVSQSWISKMERGLGRTASLETWCSVADSLGLRFVAFLEEVPGAARPRDYEHALRQELVIRHAARGGWAGVAENVIQDGSAHWRYVDVLLNRDSGRELAVVEVWDWLDDVGEGLRGLASKVERVRVQHPGAAVMGLLVVRATRQNRRLVHRLGALFSSALPASSAAWLTALADPERPMPDGAGLLWTDVGGTRLFAFRRSVAAAPEGLRDRQATAARPSAMGGAAG